VAATEFVERRVYERNGVRVTAFEGRSRLNSSKPAFGYRVDYDGRSSRDFGRHEVQREPEQARDRH